LNIYYVFHSPKVYPLKYIPKNTQVAQSDSSDFSL